MKLILDSRKPALGICGGLQLCNIASGGALIQDLKRKVRHVKFSRAKDAAHKVLVDSGTQLSKIFGKGSLQVNSSHHQAADPKRLGRGLCVTAWAPDGTVEALEPIRKGRRFFVFVQWHPERIPNAKHRRKIFSAFIRSCRRS